MEEEDFVGCISCMSTNDLYDLFASYTEDVESYAKMMEETYSIKVTNDLKYICVLCADKLEKAATFREQTVKNISIILSIQDEEYLDETILEEAESVSDSHTTQGKMKTDNEDEEYLDESILEEGENILHQNEDGNGVSKIELEEDQGTEYLDETACTYCSKAVTCKMELHEHMRMEHGLEPNTGRVLRECTLCGAAMSDPSDHNKRCHSKDVDKREYTCHFCDNVYSSRKACFTHLRMKHGLKLSCEQTPKVTQRERHKCRMCGRDFSQKQILNKHLWRVHGFEVEKRKAFICPLCNERVSYGSHFSEHLLVRHRVHEQVDKLEFHNMDDFMLYKSAIQEETKCRFRKTTASKQTIEGLRSHYMCSQSGVYVYQGKGKRPAPERQIYKTGKACPAHMILTETMDRVLVTFYKTHVGHGACPYYEPREPKKSKLDALSLSLLDKSQMKSESETEDMQLVGAEDDMTENPSSWICDECGMGFLEGDKFKDHVTAHGLKLFPCQYCESVFQNIDAWTRHIRMEHNLASLY